MIYSRFFGGTSYDWKFFFKKFICLVPQCFKGKLFLELENTNIYFIFERRSGEIEFVEGGVGFVLGGLENKGIAVERMRRLDKIFH